MANRYAYPSFLATANLFDRAASQPRTSADPDARLGGLPAGQADDPRAGDDAAKRIVQTLKDASIGIDQEALQDQLGLDPQTMKNAVARLTDLGLLERVPGKADTVRLAEFARRALDFVTLR